MKFWFQLFLFIGLLIYVSSCVIAIGEKESNENSTTENIDKKSRYIFIGAEGDYFLNPLPSTQQLPDWIVEYDKYLFITPNTNTESRRYVYTAPSGYTIKIQQEAGDGRTMYFIGDSNFEIYSPYESRCEMCEKYLLDSSFYMYMLRFKTAPTLIDDNSFSGKKVYGLWMPNSVKRIGEQAFDGSSLQIIGLSSTITNIYDAAFRGTCLKSISLPNSLLRIGAEAFKSSSLSSVEINEGCVSISRSAFENCSVSTITLPTTITIIGDCAFKSTSTKRIYCKMTKPPYISNLKGGLIFHEQSGLSIFVPRNSYPAYIAYPGIGENTQSFYYYKKYIHEYDF